MNNRPRGSILGATIGFAVGLVATAPSLVLAVASGGAGHGHYGFARLLYPHSMLLTRLTDRTITPALIVLAIVQFPLYGLAIGLASPWSRARWIVIGIISTIHLLACCACFGGLIPNFS